MTSQRCFFALSLTSPQQKSLDKWRRDVLGDRAGRPVPMANFHLTLAFLGHLSPDQIRGLCETAAALSWSPFTLTLDSFGQWRRAGIAYLAPSTVPEPLRALALQLREAGRDQGGFDETRDFKPHITLCRKAHGHLEPSRPPPPIRLAVDTFGLYASADGRYDRLASFPAQA
ncbi:RNA 2',3'-cyclic phosphodiesterase [Gallaecimonas sp. GXIMD4217]|uniref:RNA 2',3'-cyclic phosphodiesterase n=1 Tax=Gallaecimonas sp. GXIMD4217 TaxID=3131927 RepID=UPI00311B047A